MGVVKTSKTNAVCIPFSAVVLYVCAYFVSSRAQTTHNEKIYLAWALEKKNNQTKHMNQKNTHTQMKEQQQRQKKRKRTYSKLIYILWMRYDSKIKYTEIQIELYPVCGVRF